jgi:hypothetical protein
MHAAQPEGGQYFTLPWRTAYTAADESDLEHG